MSKAITVIYKGNVFRIWVHKKDLWMYYLPTSFLGYVCVVQMNEPETIHCMEDEKCTARFIKNPKRWLRMERTWLDFIINKDPTQKPLYYSLLNKAIIV